MLVLSRKVEETIIIGNDNDKIVLTILRVNGNTIRIGIQAGKQFKILRGELADKIESEQHHPA